MYDDFTFRGRSCRELGAHAFFGDTTVIGTTVSRNVYELPGGMIAEIGEPTIKPVTRKVTLVPVSGEADEAFCRRIAGWLCGGRGRLSLARDPERWRLCSFDKAAELDNRSWPEGCVQVQATLMGYVCAARPVCLSAQTSGGTAAITAAYATDVAAPLRLVLRVTGGTVTGARITSGGQTLALAGLAAGAGTEIVCDAGALELPEVRVGGALRFDCVSAWRRLKAVRGGVIHVALTGGEASVTAQLYGRWYA